MSQEVFDSAQLSAIETAVERVVKTLKAKKSGDKLIVSRAVFDIAAETQEFDAGKLADLAEVRLTPQLGWRFP